MKVDLTKGNITKHLLALMFPIIGSSFLQMSHSLINMFWIGKISTEAVAAIGSAAFFLYLGFALNAMIVMGSGIKVSHMLGEKKEEAAKEYIKAAFTLTLFSTFAFSLILILSGKELLKFFALDEDIQNMAQTYLYIASFGLFFKFLTFLYARILNSYGNSKLPFKIFSLSLCLNMLLDPLLIFVLDFGIYGLAFANVFCDLLATLLFFNKAKKYFNLKSYFSKQEFYYVELCKMGFPISLQRVLFILFAILIAKIISKWGADAIAAQKVAVQIEAITFMTIAGLQGAISSFIGQNYGAGLVSRIKECYNIAFKFTTILGLASSFIFIIFSRSLVEIFLNKEQAIEYGSAYMIIVGASQLFMAYEIMATGAFNGVGKAKIPSLISIIFTSMRIPLALLLSHPKLFGLNGVWLSIAFTSLLKGLITNNLFRNYLKRMENEKL